MPEHVPETCNESNGQWLPLIEYSVRSGVSLSTIRRKIKSNTIRYRLEKGRYLILFNEMNNLAARQPQNPTSTDIGRWQDEPLHRLDPNAQRQEPVDRDANLRSDAYRPDHSRSEAPRTDSARNYVMHRTSGSDELKESHFWGAPPHDFKGAPSRPVSPELDEERDERSELLFAERAVKLVSEAFEHALKEKEERIRLLEKVNKELEERLSELRTLVRALEEKYEVRY